MAGPEELGFVELGKHAFLLREKDKARYYFQVAIDKNPNDAVAWGWMANAALTRQERIDCLQRVLQIQPGDELAAQILNEVQENGEGHEAPLYWPPAEGEL